jgi:hypothetical protein
MIIIVAVENLKCFRAAWGQQEIMTADIIRDNGEHRPAAIGVEDVTGGEINLVRVINAASRGDRFGLVFARKRNQIGDVVPIVIPARIVLPSCAQIPIWKYMISLKRLEEAAGIRREMEILEKRLATLIGFTGPGLTTRRGRRKVSPATRAKLSAAARARWAKRRAGRSAIVPKSSRKRSGLTPAGRRRLSQLMKARWAAKRKAAPK